MSGAVAPTPSGPVLVVGLNWLGDSVMSMPALQLFRERRRGREMVMLVKRGMEPLWRLHGVCDRVETFRGNLAGTIGVARRLRGRGHAAAFVLPNSFRSAAIPFLAGIPRRVGAAGGWRAWMLNERVAAQASGAEPVHQSHEYLRIFGVAGAAAVPAPRLAVPEREAAAAARRFGVGDDAPVAAILPGAMRGPSKQWPAERFAAVGRHLTRERGFRLVVLGAAGDAETGEEVARGVGEGALSLAGKTSLLEFAALLRRCALAVSNDSGGMHVAAAVGTPVVAIFGATDPARTGPLGTGHRVVCAEGVARSRDIRARSAAAEAALRSIAPRRVVEAVEDLLGGITAGPDR